MTIVKRPREGCNWTILSLASNGINQQFGRGEGSGRSVCISLDGIKISHLEVFIYFHFLPVYQREFSFDSKTPLPFPLEKLVLKGQFLDFCDKVLENEWKGTGSEKLEEI